MLKKNTTTQEPVLAAPGAGIPFPQKMVMRFFVKPFVAGRTSWETSETNFHKINKKILSAIEGLTSHQLTTRILVPPQRGLEDSSRYWSIKMVLEHLLIVSGQMMQLIPSLSQEIVPNEKVDIAKVKPKNELNLETTVENFKRLISTDFDQLNKAVTNRSSTAKFYHPWFGDMNAQQWYWLLAMHHGLHLKQIREIKKRLPLI